MGKGKIVQVNNLVTIGGTTTCAASVTAALPSFDHEILSVGPVRDDVADELDLKARVVKGVTAADVADAAFVILNNQDASVEWPLPVPTLYWYHSRFSGQPKPGKMGHHVAWTSQWLRGDERTVGQVVHQGVPDAGHSERGDAFTVGRISTPGMLAKYHHDEAEWWRTLEIDGATYEVITDEDAIFQSVPAVRVIPPALSARHRLLSWHAMVVRSPITESFGRCIVEAMMAGCVPVTDRRGGPCETIIDGETGFLCDEGEHAERVRWLAAHPDDWRRMSNAARQHAEEHFSHEAFGRRLLTALQITLEQWHHAA